MSDEKRFLVKNGLQTQNIEFISPDRNNNITATMLDTTTISFNGTSGQLFSITDSMQGIIFAVNDISGVPSIEVVDDGTIRLAEFDGNVLVGTSTNLPNVKFQVVGGVSTDSMNLTSLSVNGSPGTSGQALYTDGENVYWGDVTTSATFTDLTDTPASYANSEGYVVTVNPTANGLVFSNDLQTQLNQQQTLVNLILMGS
jgi:hypothetical protein